MIEIKVFFEKTIPTVEYGNTKVNVEYRSTTKEGVNGKGIEEETERLFSIAKRFVNKKERMITKGYS